MWLFSKKKDLGVQSLVLKIVNNNCPELRAQIEGPRANSRVNLVVVVMIIPVENGQLQVDRAFTAVTKEFSNTGVAIILHQPERLKQAIVGFRFEGQMNFVRAEAKHMDPMGGGFCQLGFQMLEVVSPGDYPGLEGLSF